MRPLSLEISPKIDDNHKSFLEVTRSAIGLVHWPYESPFVTLAIGNKRYGLPTHFLRKSMEQLDEEIPIFELLQVTRDVFFELSRR